jgi:hypothetical protein
MSRPIPLLVPAHAGVELEGLLEVLERTRATLSFEPLEDEEPERAAALVRGAGAALSLSLSEPPALLAELGARVRRHSASHQLPAVFTEPRAALSFERGAPATAALIGALERLEAPPPLAPDAALSLALTTSPGAAAIVQAAFEHARERNGGLCVVHCAGGYPATDGLFLHAARNCAVRHAELCYEDLSFEAFARRAVRDRASFGVIAGPASAADRALDLLAAVAGVLRPAGVVLGARGERLFGRHGAGGEAALLVAAGALLEYLGQESAAGRLERALEEAALHGDFRREPLPIVAAILAR